MFPAVAIPALVALVFTLGLLGYSTRFPRRSVTTYILCCLLGVFALNSLIEFSGFCIYAGELTAAMERLGFAYIACVIVAAAFILHASLRVGCDVARNEIVWTEVLLYVPAAILLYLLVATDLVVIGFQTFRGTMLRIPGPLYRLFEVYLPCYVLISMAYLGYGARGSRPSAVRRARSRLWLFALVPIAILIGYLIVANHFGVARITSTIYMPIPWLIFLAVATFATHRYRLLDLAFFVPGSMVRRRKKALYSRIHSLTSEIGGFGSNDEILNAITGAFGCSAVLVEHAPRAVQGAITVTRDSNAASAASRFSSEELQAVERMVVTEELEDSHPKLHALMKDHRVGAIAPIKSNPGCIRRWVLLGEEFAGEVCTPLDFRHVEALFDRIGASLREETAPLRSELREARTSLEDLRTQLGRKWHELAALRKRAEIAEAENCRLHDEVDNEKRRGSSAVQAQPSRPMVRGQQELRQMLAEHEAAIVRAALMTYADHTDYIIRAAQLLGISAQELFYLIARHGLDS